MHSSRSSWIWLFNGLVYLFLVLVTAFAVERANAFTGDAPVYAAADAKKYLKKSGVSSLQGTDKTNVAITEFVIEYVTETSKGADGSGLVGRVAMTGLKKAGVGRSQMKIDEAAKGQLAADLYPIFVSRLEEQGFTVLTLEDVAGSAAYESFATETKGSRSRTTDYQHLTGVATRESSETYSVAGLAVQKSGAFGQMKNMKAGARLMHELSVDRTLQVRLRVMLNKGQLSLDKGSMVFVTTGYNMTHMPGGKEIFNPKKTGQLQLKKPLVHPGGIVDEQSREFGEGKVSQVNSEALLRNGAALFDGFSLMVAATL